MMYPHPPVQHFFPKVGQKVTNKSAKVYNDEVMVVHNEGFTCKKSGYWIGNTEGWK